MADREAVSRWLGQAVRRGLLTPLEAAQVKDVDLPLPGGIPVDLPEAVFQQAATELVGLVRGKAFTGEWQDALEVVAAWKLRMLLAAHEAVQDEAESKFALWARWLAAGGIALATWQTLMRERTQTLLAQQLILGKGEWPSRHDREVAQGLVQRETLFLDRFADDIAAKRATGQPLSEGQVRARSNLYTGTARGEFYRALESDWQPVVGATKEEGWCVHYVARDDKGTCLPCHRAQGWYLPGAGPLPGQVCEGRAQCRCRRVLTFDTERWRQLLTGAKSTT